jgi:hypothetical protein
VQPPTRIKAAIPEDTREYNGSLGQKSIAEHVLDIDLASSTRAMKEETAARTTVDSIHDLIKGRALVRIETVDVFICHELLMSLVIVSLLHDQAVSQQVSLSYLRQWHRRKVFQRRALSSKQVLHQVETIVINLLL